MATLLPRQATLYSAGRRSECARHTVEKLCNQCLYCEPKPALPHRPSPYARSMQRMVLPSAR